VKITRRIITVAIIRDFSPQGPQLTPVPFENIVPLNVVQVWHKGPKYPGSHSLAKPPLLRN